MSGWLAAAIAAAWASSLVIVHPTPIDHALPLLAVVVTLLAAVSHPAVQVALPLLLVAEIALPDETARLLAFGVVLAVAWSAAVMTCHLDARDDKRYRSASVILALSAVVLLRWIPLADVLWTRELILLALAAAIVVALRGTPFGIAVAVLIALVTPAVPLRTFALPLVVLLVAAVTRPKARLTIPSVAAVAIVLTFFAWSGIAARAFPYLLKPVRTTGERHFVNAALAPNRSLTVDVPEGATALIVSGANVPRFRRGYQLGSMEPGGRAIRIGDASDWGFLRRESFYAACNPLPRDPAGRIRGYGYAAWLDGAGRVPLPRGARSIRITADAHLPADASLQVEAFELAPR